MRRSLETLVVTTAQVPDEVTASEVVTHADGSTWIVTATKLDPRRHDGRPTARMPRAVLADIASAIAF